MLLNKLLAFAFWELRRIFKGFYDDGLDEWKALLVIGCVEMATLFTLLALVSLALGHKLPLNGRPGAFFIVVLTALGIMVTNQFAKRRWGQFEKEFESYTRSKKTIGGFLVVAILILVFGATVFSLGAARTLPAT